MKAYHVTGAIRGGNYEAYELAESSEQLWAEDCDFFTHSGITEIEIVEVSTEDLVTVIQSLL